MIGSIPVSLSMKNQKQDVFVNIQGQVYQVSYILDC